LFLEGVIRAPNNVASVNVNPDAVTSYFGTISSSNELSAQCNTS
jgi:hypothetical protein